MAEAEYPGHGYIKAGGCQLHRKTVVVAAPPAKPPALHPECLGPHRLQPRTVPFGQLPPATHTGDHMECPDPQDDKEDRKGIDITVTRRTGGHFRLSCKPLLWWNRSAALRLRCRPRDFFLFTIQPGQCLSRPEPNLLVRIVFRFLQCWSCRLSIHPHA